MREFKVGDRVVVYDAQLRTLGTVVELLSADVCRVQSKQGYSYEAHYKQCRRLIRKPKQKLWISPLDIEAKSPQPCVSYDFKEGWVELEVRSGTPPAPT